MAKRPSVPIGLSKEFYYPRQHPPCFTIIGELLGKYPSERILARMTTEGLTRCTSDASMPIDRVRELRHLLSKWMDDK